MVLYLIAYFSVGALVGLLTMDARGGREPGDWLFLVTGAWPLVAAVLVWRGTTHWRRLLKSRIDSRPPKWYDTLYWWLL